MPSFRTGFGCSSGQIYSGWSKSETVVLSFPYILSIFRILSSIWPNRAYSIVLNLSFIKIGSGFAQMRFRFRGKENSAVKFVTE